MTPQQKAKQLVDKYTFSCRECDNAKQCALIAVDEIIDSEALEPQQKRHIIQNVPPIKCQLEYWFKVKTEIEKI